MWYLGSGELVFDRNKSHLHPGVIDILPEALLKISLQGEDFAKIVVNFDRIIGKNHLVATRPSDQVVYAKRPKRWGHSRFVMNREPEDCSGVVVILKKADEGGYLLITAFIGDGISTPEPWDTRAFSKEVDPVRAEDEAYDFWSRHALVLLPETEIFHDTLTTECPW